IRSRRMAVGLPGGLRFSEKQLDVHRLETTDRLYGAVTGNGFRTYPSSKTTGRNTTNVDYFIGFLYLHRSYCYRKVTQRNIERRYEYFLDKKRREYGKIQNQRFICF